MNPFFEQALIEVWRQALVENSKVVDLGSERYPVRSTPKKDLRKVDFMSDGNEIQGLEQNPRTKSRWAEKNAIASCDSLYLCGILKMVAIPGFEPGF
jgi:hypothetical protein